MNRKGIIDDLAFIEMRAVELTGAIGQLGASIANANGVLIIEKVHEIVSRMGLHNDYNRKV